MSLLLDVGNSQLKARSHQAAAAGKAKVSGKLVVVSQAQGVELAVNQLHAELSLLDDLSQLGEVWVSSVKSAEINQALRQQLTQVFKLPCRFAKTQRQQAGLVCAYEDESRLGVDRWLAMLAAYTRQATNLCVIDCGTATTVDVINAAGEHLGGYILPGADLMARSLLLDTDQVRFERGGGKPFDLSWGKNTSDCVRNGISFCQLALLEKSIASVAEQFDNMQAIITGGYSGVIMSTLSARVSAQLSHVPDLVLDGLAIYGGDAA